MGTTENLFGQRLRQARTMRGWSLRELAQETGSKVSHNALARYERGEMSPGSAVLIAVAAALEQPVDFFVRPFTIKLAGIRFRKKAGLSEMEKKAVREQAVDFLERYREAEEIVGDVRTFVPPLDGNPVRSLEEAEQLATALREKWNLGNDAIPSVIELLENKGIKVCELTAAVNDGFDGFSAATDAGPVVVLAGWLDKNLPRKRMTAVHELAHVVLPLPEDEELEEKIATYFAGAFLLPKETFSEAFGKVRNRFSLRELIEMKLQFGVSIMAMMTRANQLGLIQAATYRKFWEYVKQEQWREKGGEPGDEEYRGQEAPMRFPQLVRRAVAEEEISLSKGAALLNQDLGAFRKELREVIA